MNEPVVAGSGTMLSDVPRTRSSNRSRTASGCENVRVKVDGPVVLDDVDGRARVVSADTDIVSHQFLHANDLALIIDHSAGAGVQLRHYTPRLVALVAQLSLRLLLAYRLIGRSHGRLPVVGELVLEESDLRSRVRLRLTTST